MPSASTLPQKGLKPKSSHQFAWEHFDAVLFDLDGVVTPTAEIHEQAWSKLFANGFDYSNEDYLGLIDGKPRFQGVKDFLASRDIELPDGSPDDPPDAKTVWGYGNRKNRIFNRILARDGVSAFQGTLDAIDTLDVLGLRYGLVSSSRNAEAVLLAAGLNQTFEVVVDGNTTAARGLPGKPAPDGYLLGAELLGVDPARTVVIEDAVSGVQAGAAGGFGAVIGVNRGAGKEALLQGGADFVVSDLSRLGPRPGTGMRRGPVPKGLPQDRFPADPWRLVEKRHEAGDLGHTETLFAQANGYLGMRANPEEGREAHSHGTYINGFHETWDIQHAEDAFGFARTGQTIVNVPDTKLIKLYVDDEPLVLSTAELLSYERSLDFRSGVLTRELTWLTPAGKRVEVRSKRLVSLVNRHLAVMTYEVTVPEDSASIVISSQTLNRQTGESDTGTTPDDPDAELDPRRAMSMTDRVLVPEVQRRTETDVILGFRTATSGMTMACGTRHVVDSGPTAEVEPTIGLDSSKIVISAVAKPGETIRVTKYVVYHASEGVVPTHQLADRCERSLARAERTGADAIETEQADYLADFWACSDVEIDGDLRHQQAIRWNLFQLGQASACSNEQSLPAKGLSGAGYDGHYFWDTEAYIIPFLAHTNQIAARKALRFRWNTLDRARARADEMSHPGALYPWRTINGEECSAYYAAGTAQYHINAAVAYAIERYVSATGDVRFLAAEGAEILIETARLWLDLGFHDSDGTFHIHRVTGPDEYTTVVNDNTYTNVMAQAGLRYAAASLRRLGAEAPEELERIKAATELGEDEPGHWVDAADAMFIPYDEKLEVHPQDATFFDLAPWPWNTTPASKYPLLLNFHPLVIYRHQVLKQADVVLIGVMRPDTFSLEECRRDFDYYDPITTGDSSLSAAAQATVAAQVGRGLRSWDYFQRALYLDLCDTHHNTIDGVHLASTGGVWNAIVAGYLGFTDDGEMVRFDPRVPPALGSITVRLTVRGVPLRIEAERTRCVVSVHDDGEILVADLNGGRQTAAVDSPVIIEAGRIG